MNIIHFEAEEQYISPIGFSNLEHPPRNDKSKSQSYERLNLWSRFIHSLLNNHMQCLPKVNLYINFLFFSIADKWKELSMLIGWNNCPQGNIRK